MKKSILFFILILLSTFSIAQDYPDFGVPDKEEIEMKECSFEKDAAAVVLIHEAFSYSEDNSQLITTHHIRIKILKQSGTKAANISIPYFRKNDFERISQLEAITINIADDGTLTRQKVGKKSIYSTKVNERFGEINFAFPSVKAGTILEYQYKSTMKNYYGLRDWRFQQDIPVMISRYHLKMIPDKSFTYRINKRPDLEATVLPEQGKIFFEMRNIPAIVSEPYMDAKEDNIQGVNLQINGYNSRWGSYIAIVFQPSWVWINTGLLLRENFGPQILADISGTNNFISEVKLLKSSEEKIIKIYNYVKNKMIWNNFYSIGSIDGVNNAWKKGTGTTGDINLILINLLNNADLNVFPLLVSERENGKVDSTYPYIDQFNKMIACVILDKKKYFLDATDKYTAANLIPDNILNTTGFLIDRIIGELIFISSDSMQHREDIGLKMQVTADGFLKTKVEIKSTDYARVEKVRKYNTDKEKFKERYFKAENYTFTVDSFFIENVSNDSLPLIQKFDFNIPLSTTADYKFIPLNFFSGFEKNPFLSDNRFSNINFGYKQSVYVNAAISVPENYQVDGFPKSVRLNLPNDDIIFDRQTIFNKENNTIYYNLKIQFNKSLFGVDQYSMIKDIYKKIFNLLDEKVVLKMKDKN